VVLDLSAAEARRRLLTRSGSEGLRTDDAPVVAERRLQVQAEMLAATVSSLAESVPVFTIDATGPPEATTRSILRALVADAPTPGLM